MVEILPYNIDLILMAMGAHLLAPFAPAVFAAGPLFGFTSALYLLF